MILLMIDLQADPVKQLEESVTSLLEQRVTPLHLKETHHEAGNKIVPLLVLVNKYDDEGADEDYEIFCQLLEGDWPLLPISVETDRNIDQLEQLIFDELKIIRVYSKMPGKDADLTSPFVANQGCTVEEFARKVHKDFYDNLKSARVWGSGDFDGQMVSRDHVLQDEDVVELKM